MENNRKAQEQILELVERDRLQTTTMVAQEIVDRIKSPLSMIRGRAEYLKSHLEFYQKENAQGILDQIDQLEKLLASVQGFVNLTEGAPKNIPVHELVEDLTLFFQYRLSKAKVQVMNIVPLDFALNVAECDIKSILMSTLVNAIEALEDSNDESKTIFIQYQKTASRHILSIEDSGPGIPPIQMKSLYQPFSSTKKGHVGMSLAICRKIAEKCGWKLEIVSRLKHGTRVEIWIPHSSGSGSV
jgi:C4-dicarboxylate-specific signal transduction histidine kinase